MARWSDSILYREQLGWIIKKVWLGKFPLKTLLPTKDTALQLHAIHGILFILVFTIRGASLKNDSWTKPYAAKSEPATHSGYGHWDYRTAGRLFMAVTLLQSIEKQPTSWILFPNLCLTFFNMETILFVSLSHSKRRPDEDLLIHIHREANIGRKLHQ